MEAIKINKNCWHYKIARKLGGWKECKYNDSPNDFCSYLTAFLGGLFKIALLIAFVSYLLIGYYRLFYWIHTRFVEGIRTPLDFPSIFAVVITFLSIYVGILLWLWKYLERRKKQKTLYVPVTKGPSFLKSAYISLKDKVCFQVELIDEDK